MTIWLEHFIYQVQYLGSSGAVSGQFTFITGSHVKSIMQDACCLAYPDPNHYMRKHIHCITSHLNQIVAAITLKNAGVPNEEIAFWLRWSVEALKFFLCDCVKAISHSR